MLAFNIGIGCGP